MIIFIMYNVCIIYSSDYITQHELTFKQVLRKYSRTRFKVEVLMICDIKIPFVSWRHRKYRKPRGKCKRGKTLYLKY